MKVRTGSKHTGEKRARAMRRVFNAAMAVVLCMGVSLPDASALAEVVGTLGESPAAPAVPAVVPAATSVPGAESGAGAAASAAAGTDLGSSETPAATAAALLGEDILADEEPEGGTITASSASDAAAALLGDVTGSDGRAYRAELAYGPDAGIPAGSTLSVRELSGAEYSIARTRAQRALDESEVRHLRAFDITIVDPDGNAVEPKAPVEVRISLAGAATLAAASTSSLKVVHLGSGAPEVVESESSPAKGATTVGFTSDSFSVYAIAYTLDYYFQSASGKTWKITATYDSNAGIPEGAEMSVRELAREECDSYVDQTAEALGRDPKAVDIAAGFDIRFVKDGVEYHDLDGAVHMTMQLLDHDVTEYAQIVHMGDVPERVSAVSANKTLLFDSSQFSVYIVAKEELMQHFKFMNGDDVFAEQVLINGENIARPADPTKPGAVFNHWEDDFAEGVNVFEVSTYLPVVINDSANADECSLEGVSAGKLAEWKELCAGEADLDDKQKWLDDNPTLFRAIYDASKTTITFYNQSGLIVDTREVTKPAAGEDPVSFDTKTVTYLPIQDKEGAVISFKYWTEDVRGTGSQVGGDGVISINGSSPNDIALYPYLEDGHYLYFDANKNAYGISSADFTSPVTVANSAGSSNDAIKRKAESVCAQLNARDNHAIPTATGYVFEGWYIRANASESAEDQPVFKPNADRTALEVVYQSNGKPEYAKLLNSFGNLPNNPTLYARWSENSKTSYTIAVWKQNAIDSNSYDYVDSVTVPDVDTGSTPGTYYQKEYAVAPDNGFKAARAVPTDATVKSDGSTTMNIYYDRQTVTINYHTFQYQRDDNNGMFGFVDGSYVRIAKRQNSYNTYCCWLYDSAPYSGAYYRNQNGTPVEVTGDLTYAAKYYGVFDGFLKELTCYQYNGSRYSGSWKLYKTLTGLYGQYFTEDNPWPTEYDWYTNGDNYGGTGGTRTTFLQGFLPTDADQYTLNFYGSSPNGTLEVRWHKQNVGADGAAIDTYTQANTALTSGGRFNITDKYNGFTANMYSIDGGAPVEVGAKDPSTGVYGNPVEYTNSLDIYFSRNANTLRFNKNDGSTGSNAVYKTERNVPFESPLKNWKPADPTREGYIFAGWYYDSGEHQIASVDFDAATSIMPDSNLILYAKWVRVKYSVTVIPNGGNMDGQSTVFNLDPDEKIGISADPTRDFVKVNDGEGTHVYDEATGTYTLTELNDGNYVQRAGAYTFQGWYEAEMSDAGIALEQYEKDGETCYRYIQTGTPVEQNGEYKVKKRQFDLNVAPNRPVTLVAMWQRAGGFRVEYNTGYENIQAPEDQDEYIDGSHAVAKAAIGAPAGNVFAYWQDKLGNRYMPNELVEISERNAVSVGSEMVVKLTAVYRDYNPSERDMADYTFMAKDRDGVYQKYDVQRIAVNEELKAPITPEPPSSDYMFKGWYYDSAGINRFDGFGPISAPVYTTIYAVFEKAFTVNYYLTDSNTMTPTTTVIATQKYPDDGEDHYLDTRHVSHPVDVDHYVDMWVSDWDNREVENNQYPYNAMTDVKVESNMSMYAVLVAREYVEFDSQGGSYVDTQEVPSGGWPVRPADPTKEGFIFDGWYTAPSGGNLYEFGGLLSNTEGYNGRLYAHWRKDPMNPKKGNLHVIFWAQTADRPEDDAEAARDTDHYQMIQSVELSNVDYDNYSRDDLKAMLPAYVDGDFDIVKTVQTAIGSNSHEASAFVNDTLGYKGSNADVVRLWNANNYVTELNNYYEFNSAKSSQAVTVDDEGHSVLNIRFDLKKFYLEFKPENKAEIHYNGMAHPVNGSNNYKVPIWLNRPISDQWPIDKLVNPDRAGAYLNWNESGKVFTCWKAGKVYIAEGAKKDEADSVNTIYKISEKTNAEYRTPINLADKLLIDSVREFGNNGNVLALTPVSKAETGYKAVVHYMVRDGNVDTFTEKTELQQVISVPGQPGDNDWTGNPGYYVLDGKNVYARFTGAVCNVHGVSHDGRRYAYCLLEPIGLSGYVGLDNETAHNGALKDKDGNWETGYNENPKKNTSELYNLISNRIGLAHVLFDKTDKAYDEYFKYHLDQYVDAPNTYNFYFYYKPLPYTLSFYSDSATQVGNTLDVFNGEDLAGYIQDIGVPDVPAGYNHVTFKGWALSPYQTDPSAAIDAGGKSVIMPSHNLTLYAIWKPITYTVTTVGVDSDNDGEDDVYETTYGKKLKELYIPNPKKNGKLFMGWKIAETEATITGNYEIRGDLRIEPIWNNLQVHTISYDLNGGREDVDGKTTANSTPPEDDNEYMVGAKAVILNGESPDGNKLVIDRLNIDGEPYKGTFSYWNTKRDGTGDSYYPNTTYTFHDGSDNLTLYAIYSQYHETKLIYDLNARDDDTARFVLRRDGTTPYYKEGEESSVVKVLYRDQLNENFNKKKSKTPNQVFPVGQDDEGVNFTAVREDTLGNEYVLTGWALDSDASVPVAQDGDRAYVNTIKIWDEKTNKYVQKNTLYAIWAVCKIVHGGKEHVFDTLGKAVAYARAEMGGKATIQMLVDYKMPEDDRVVLGESTDDITITTATDGEYRYTPSSGTGTTATITQSFVPDAGDGGSSEGSDAPPDKAALFEQTAANSLAFSNVTIDGGGPDMAGRNARLVSASGGASVTLGSGATLQNAYAVGSDGAGDGAGVMLASGAKLTMTAATEGAAGSKIINNGATGKGGAVYAASGCTVNMPGGEVSGNSIVGYANNAVATTGDSVTGDGAGIYLENGATLNLSGNPNFGAGNFSGKTLDSSATNGGEEYNRARQDIYLAGTGTPLGTLQVTDVLSGDEGSIWVWPNDASGDVNHYQMQKQFAVFANGVKPEDDDITYRIFRNARADADSEAAGDYLTGTAEGDPVEGYDCIYWSGSPGERKVVLRKISRYYTPVTGAVFDIHRGTNASPYNLKLPDGTRTKLEDLACPQDDTTGVFWIGTLPSGTYFIHEKTVPNGFEGAGTDEGRWFYLIVNADGIDMSEPYADRATAKAAADTAIAAAKAAAANGS